MAILPLIFVEELNRVIQMRKSFSDFDAPREKRSFRSYTVKKNLQQFFSLVRGR